MFNPCWLLLWLLPFDVEVPLDGHIAWRFSSIQQNKSEWELVFTAKVDTGWHLYSQSIEEGGPMPTSFEFEKNDFARMIGKVREAGEPKTVYDSTFMMNVVWYENEVVFTQRVKMRSRSTVTGEIDYSVCSEEKCIPGTVRFSIDAGI